MSPAFVRSLQLAGHMLRHSLSGRVLWLTILFVLVAEVFLWVPSITRFHQDNLMMRLSAAQIAVLALDQISPDDLRPALKRELLANAEARAIALKRNQTRRLYLAEPMPPTIATTIETRGVNFAQAAIQAFDTLFFGEGRFMRVVGAPRLGGGEFIEIVADEGRLRQDMIAYTGRIAQLSLLVALITAIPVFLVLRYALVRPMQRLTQSMMQFQSAPYDASRIIVPSMGQGEMAQAERVLASMQMQIRQALQQQSHLAALGLAVAKIQHDLRNILTTAQLTSDRLSASEDPQVKKLLPRLEQSIGRAIALANNTLRYGRAEESPPRPTRFPLGPLLDEVAAGALAAGKGAVTWDNRAPAALEVHADQEQLLRILLNVGRNAVEALESRGGGRIRVDADRAGDMLLIDMADDGPGIPQKAQDALFKAFAGSTGKSGGTGLGLAIAQELARGHGGDLTLLRTSDEGTVFRVQIPQPSTA
jgi:signal transduction histidine kinase